MKRRARIDYAWPSAVLAPKTIDDIRFAVKPQDFAERPKRTLLWMLFRKF